MADNLSNLAENALLEALFLKTTLSLTAPLVLALYTVAPSDTGGGTEVTGGSYARTAIGVMNSASGGTITNSADIVFPTATADWGTVVAGGVFDSTGTPKFLCYATLTTSQNVVTGVAYSIPAGQLSFSLS